VRKSSFVTHEERSGAYHPETHHSCTVHAGTFVQQASCWAPHQCRHDHDAAIATLLLALCYFEFPVWHIHYATFPTSCMAAWLIVACIVLLAYVWHMLLCLAARPTHICSSIINAYSLVLCCHTPVSVQFSACLCSLSVNSPGGSQRQELRIDCIQAAPTSKRPCSC